MTSGIGVSFIAFFAVITIMALSDYKNLLAENAARVVILAYPWLEKYLSHIY